MHKAYLDNKPIYRVKILPHYEYSHNICRKNEQDMDVKPRKTDVPTVLSFHKKDPVRVRFQCSYCLTYFNDKKSVDRHCNTRKNSSGIWAPPACDKRRQIEPKKNKIWNPASRKPIKVKFVFCDDNCQLCCINPQKNKRK